jgi:hypothetical protein
MATMWMLMIDSREHKHGEIKRKRWVWNESSAEDTADGCDTLHQLADDLFHDNPIICLVS